MTRYMDLINAEPGCKIPGGTVAAADQAFGFARNEPLSTGMMGALRYAVAHKERVGSPLAEDYVLGPHFLGWINGLRGLLNGQGAVAMETDRGTDSKDNGFCESVFWLAVREAGYTEADID